MNSRTVNTIVIGITLWAILIFAGCHPATSSRIGPPLPARGEDCTIVVLEAGATPDTPYRDVGTIFLKNCPHYDRGACRNWVTAEACRLGGDLVYLPENADGRSRPEALSGEVSWTLTVAASISRMPITDKDPVLHSTPAASCDKTPVEEADDPEDQMCTE